MNIIVGTVKYLSLLAAVILYGLGAPMNDWVFLMLVGMALKYTPSSNGGNYV